MVARPGPSSQRTVSSSNQGQALGPIVDRMTALSGAAVGQLLAGIGFDLAEVGPIFEEYAETNRVSDRVRFEPGDFFTQALPRVDVITMGHILHDWDLKNKKMLVSKARAPEFKAWMNA